MALRFDPYNFGGGELGTGIAKGTLGVVGQAEERQRQKQTESFQREKILYDMQSNIDPLTAMFENNKRRYNELIKWYNEQRDDLIVKNKGINQKVLLEMSTRTNLVNNEISRIKQEESQISEWTKAVFDSKNDGLYSKKDYNLALADYLNTSMSPQRKKFLVRNPMDPFVYTGKQSKKPTGEYEVRQGNNVITYTKYADDKERVGKYNEMWNDEGLVRGMIGIFSGQIQSDANPTDDERQKYMQMAKVLRDENKSLTGNINSDAVYLWGSDNIMPTIYQDKKKSEVRWKDTQGESKKIKITELPKTKFSYLGENYDNFVDITKKGVRKTVNIVLPDSAREIRQETKPSKYTKEMRETVRKDTPRDAGVASPYSILGVDLGQNKILLTKVVKYAEGEEGYDNIVELPLENYKYLLDDIVDIENLQLLSNQTQTSQKGISPKKTISKGVSMFNNLFQPSLQIYEVNGQRYEIPKEKVNEFLSEFPKAKRL